jgi:predicted solute-binding protein
LVVDSIGEYIMRGASSVVLSDAIFDKEAISQCNFSKIYELAQSATLLGNQAVNRWHLYKYLIDIASLCYEVFSLAVVFIYLFIYS